MEMAAGEPESADLRVTFDRRLKLEFLGSKVTSDAGLLAFREVDDAPGLTEIAGQVLADGRTGKNNRHTLTGQFRQLVFVRLAGCEDVNGADRLGHNPAMRWIVGGRAVANEAMSTSQTGRLETEVLTGKSQSRCPDRPVGEMDRRGLCPTLTLPDEMESWSLTTIREKVVKIGAKVIAHARYAIFQMAEVAVPRDRFRRILDMIDDLRPRGPAPC